MTDTPAFLSPDEIADVLFESMKPEDKAYIIAEVPNAEDMIVYHHGVGTQLRNEFKLWDRNNPYTKPDAAPNPNTGIIDDPLFPDQVSHAILMKVWRKVTEGVRD